MPTPAIPIQIIQGQNHLGSQRVEVKISYEGQKVRLLVAQDRFITIFKQMARPVVPTVKILSIPRQKPPHDRGDTMPAALEEDMNMLCEVPNYVKLSSHPL
jgi:hypothetical protein